MMTGRLFTVGEEGSSSLAALGWANWCPSWPGVCVCPVPDDEDLDGQR
jgi:hypothetical protein